MTAGTEIRHGVDDVSKKAGQRSDWYFIASSWPSASWEEEQRRARSILAHAFEEEMAKLGVQQVPWVEEPVPEPDFRSAGILFGPQFLFDALTRRNEMYDALDEGSVDEALEIAE